MNEQEHTNKPGDEPDMESDSAPGRESDEIAQEINRLADAFARAVRAAWKSEQRVQLEHDLRTALNSLVVNVEETLTHFSKSEQGQELRQQTERVVEKVRTSQVAADLEKGLKQGLATVASEIHEFAQKLEEDQDEGNSDVEVQDIPVENDESQS